MKSSAALSALLALLTPAAGVLGLLRPNAAPQIRPQQQLTGGTDATSLDGTATGTNGWGTFNQLIDHSNPSLGTFKQRYWYGTKYWNGPGSPIILVSMAEQDASGSNQTYLGLSSMPGVMAQAVGGAVIILEYRYFGASSPFDQLTVENLQYLTLDNLAKDQTYFANNFDPPFDHSGKSSPKNAAWVYVGAGSAGYLISYMDVVSPGTFWAYYGSGSSVQPIGDFWQYFTPVQEAASANCSSDINLVIEYVDDILLHGTEDEKLKLKDKFQLRDLTDADFAWYVFR